MSKSLLILLGHKETAKARVFCETLAPILDRNNHTVVACDADPFDLTSGKSGACSLEHLQTDALSTMQQDHSAAIMIAVGGDGTILHYGRVAAKHQLPIMGINVGTLGFLAEFEPQPDTIIQTLKNIEDLIEHRMLLEVSHYSNDTLIEQHLAVNDAVINRNALSRMMQLEVQIGRYSPWPIRADGLIVSTPVGSTAYNMSAGGPIITPDQNLAILNPICSHGLANRPLVIQADRTTRIHLHEADEAFLTIDGQVGVPLGPTDRVEITRSPHSLHIVANPDTDFMALLQAKLLFGGLNYRTQEQ